MVHVRRHHGEPEDGAGSGHDQPHRKVRHWPALRRTHSATADAHPASSALAACNKAPDGADTPWMTRAKCCCPAFWSGAVSSSRLLPAPPGSAARATGVLASYGDGRAPPRGMRREEVGAGGPPYPSGWPSGPAPGDGDRHRRQRFLDRGHHLAEYDLGSSQLPHASCTYLIAQSNAERSILDQVHDERHDPERPCRHGSAPTVPGLAPGARLMRRNLLPNLLRRANLITSTECEGQ